MYSDVYDFILYCSDGTEQSTMETLAADELSLEINGLIPHTEYTVYVEGMTIEIGEQSDEVTVTTEQTGKYWKELQCSLLDGYP